jgi:GNAT superfamily N-acetyltransferase
MWRRSSVSPVIRRCRDDELEAVGAIVNAAAVAYRGVIPEDRWHEPYMGMAELRREVEAGVEFWGYEDAGELLGVMGIQAVADVSLIRHAYVLPSAQGRGIGGALLRHLESGAARQLLVGTWAVAEWAIAFYRAHGFVPAERPAELLRRYWSIPEEQVATSVVLAKPPL